MYCSTSFRCRNRELTQALFLLLKPRSGITSLIIFLLEPNHIISYYILYCIVVNSWTTFSSTSDFWSFLTRKATVEEQVMEAKVGRFLATLKYIPGSLDRACPHLSLKFQWRFGQPMALWPDSKKLGFSRAADFDFCCLLWYYHPRSARIGSIFGADFRSLAWVTENRQTDGKKNMPNTEEKIKAK